MVVQLNIQISQGDAATDLKRGGGLYKCFFRSSLQNAMVKGLYFVTTAVFKANIYTHKYHYSKCRHYLTCKTLKWMVESICWFLPQVNICNWYNFVFWLFDNICCKHTSFLTKNRRSQWMQYIYRAYYPQQPYTVATYCYETPYSACSMRWKL